MALVEFVEDYCGIFFQLRVRDQFAQEYALCFEYYPGFRAGPVVEAHAVAHLAAGGAAPLLRHAVGQHARGQAARLQDRYPAFEAAAVEEQLRDLGGFP